MNSRTMKRSRRILMVAWVLAGLATAALAGKPNGNGNGGGGGGGNEINPATITFSDVGTQLASDGGGAYVHGVGGVEAFIGSQANNGNIWLRTVDAPGRGVLLDFSQCESVDAADCTLFGAAVNGEVSIKIDADAILNRGVYDMAIGSFIHPSMRVYYDDGTGQTRFVDFNNSPKGGNPCKNQGVVNVEVERTGAGTWVVRAPGEVSPNRPTACANSPLRTDSFQGLYWMAFEFVVEEQP